MKRVYHVFFFLFVLMCNSVYVFAQQTKERLYISFYNVENLFDTLDDKHANDNEFLPKSAKKWNTEKYQQKIEQVSRVILAMNEGNAPDVLGVCEIENRTVLEDLAKNLKKKNKNPDYGIIHHDSKDTRGTDVALFYKKNKFTEIDHQTFEVVDSNLRTRDILLSSLKTSHGDTLYFIVNHFPSRLGGKEKSAEKRNAAAYTLKNIFYHLQNTYSNPNVVILGDFNDEPDNESIGTVLSACPVSNEQTDCKIFNLFYTFSKEDKGSYWYKNNWEMLDQAMVSNVLYNKKNHWRADTGSAEIISFEWMLTTDNKNRKIPWRTWKGKSFLNGFSDHLPIGFYIEHL